MTRFIELEDALFVVQKLGFNVKDTGLLDSSLSRPKTELFGEAAYGSFELKAAAMAHSLIKNHALVDGNKRLTWTLLVSFLAINDLKHDMSTDEAFDLVIGLATDAYAIQQAAEIIKRHIVDWAS